MNKMITLIEKQLNNKRLTEESLLSFYESNEPISIEQMRKTPEIFDWSILSEGCQFEWSLEILHEFEDYWDWEVLSSNDALPWSEELVEQFKSNWNWEKLSKNQFLSWTEVFLLKHWDHLDFVSIFNNPKILWRMDFIKKNFTINEYSLMNCLPLPLIKQIINEKLVQDYPFTITIKEEDPRWVEVLLKQPDSRFVYSSRFHKPIINLETSMEECRVYSHKRGWDWWYGSTLCERSDAPWNLELIEKYKDKLFEIEDYDFQGNQGLFWTEEILDRFFDRLDWYELSANPSLPWSLSLIEKYEKYWDWDNILYQIKGVAKNDRHKKLLSLFRDEIDWSLLCEISEKLIEKA